MTMTPIIQTTRLEVSGDNKMDLKRNLSPLVTNESTGEPYLRLPQPHSDIIITPPRLSDVEPLTEILNDHRVCHWMTGPTNPYLREHGKAWIESQKKETGAILQDLETAEEPRRAFATGCPIRIIREEQGGGTDKYLGFIGVYRSEHKDIFDDSKREAALEEDSRRIPGDPGIVWDLANYLAPSYHGKGIMSAAVAAVIEEWAIPRLNSHIIRASVLQGNKASVRVLEKNGFFLVKTDENYQEVRGEMRGVHWLEWAR